MSNQLRLKGRFVKKTVLDTRIQRRERMVKKHAEWRNLTSNAEPSGRIRIVDLTLLGEKLECVSCKSDLRLKNIEDEKKTGLLSILRIKCHSCSMYTEVPTSASHEVNSEAKKFVKAVHHNDMTTNAVLEIYPNMYRRYEKEVGPAIEAAAKDSCRRSALEERRLVLEKIRELRKNLPPDVCKEFEDELTLLERIASNNLNNARIFDKTLGTLIGCIVPLDMGWSKRGNGKSYDSLNGYGAIIGFLSGKILDYRTRNRKCKMCDKGHSKDDHDCRLNFHGSAKAMEADVGLESINHSKILEEAGLTVKVVIADEDSTVMAAVNQDNKKNNPARKVIKLADMNHVKKNLTKKIYKIQPKFKELQKKGLIAHIKKCFSYAVHQCKNDSGKLSSAVRSIPDHLFGCHENCGPWCSSQNCTENPKKVVSHKFVLKDQGLYKSLMEIFTIYANNASKYSTPVSSNRNESWNSSVSHQLPKNKSYSTTSNADVRVATAVLVKNDGNSYVPEVKRRLGVPVYKSVELRCSKADELRKRKSEKQQTTEAKKRRVKLSLDRENLRKNLESREGITYQSNIAFELQNNEVSQQVDLVDESPVLSRKKSRIAYFDLETSGRQRSADILQIAIKLNDKLLSIYIQPTQPVDEQATEINGLTNVNGNLFLRGKAVETVSMPDALESVLNFLSKSPGGCLLVAHNASFDMSFLLREIKKYSFVEKFKNVIYGFCDTYALFRRKFPERKEKGMLTLSKLAQDFLENDSGSGDFHEATYDVIVLDKLVQNTFTNDDLFSRAKSYASAVNESIQRYQINLRTKLFAPMKGDLTQYMINKLAASRLTFEELLSTYGEGGEEAVILLLSTKENGKPRVTNKKEVLSKIVESLKKISSSQRSANISNDLNST